MIVKIRTKLVWLIFFIVLLVGGTISVYSIYQERKQSLTAYAAENRQIAALLSELVLDDLDFNDLGGLRNRLRDAQAYPRILYAYVMDSEGKVLADGSGADYLSGIQLNDPFNERILRSTDWVTVEGETVLKIGGPVYLPGKKALGYLAVGFSLDPAYQRMQQATIASVTITIIGLVVGGVLAIVIATRMTRPISEMVRASRRIGEGNFDTQLSVQRRDELSLLAESINGMARELKVTTISKAYVDEIIKSLQDSLIVLTPQATIETVNPATLALLGYDQAELIGKPVSIVFQSREKQRKTGESPPRIDLIQKGQSLRNVETTYWTKNGYGISVLLSASLVRDASGQVQGIACIARDITDRKRSDQRVRESEQRYRSLVAAAGSIIIGLTADFRVVEWNREAEAAYGWRRAEVLGKDYIRLCLSGTEGKRVEAHIRDSLNREAPHEFEASIRRPDGSTHTFLWTSTPLDDEEGGTTGVILVGQDISEQKKAEEALRRETKNLLGEKYFIDSTINSLPGSFYMFDQEGRFLRWNKNFEKHSEYSASEIRKMKPLDFFDAEEKSLIMEKIAQVYSAGEASVEAHMVSKTGKRIPYLLTGSRIGIDDGIYLAGWGLDISERKQVENTLRESEERHRSLTEGVLDSSEVGIFILDSSFRVVWVNQAMARYCGLRRSDIIGQDKREFVRSRVKNLFEDSEGFAKKVFGTYDDNSYVENFECHVKAAAGREERWLEHWSQPIRTGLYAGGRIEHYYDITERKRAEEALKQSEFQVRQALEEREQLGRDLHDGILQSLFAVNLGLESSKSLVHDDGAKAVQNLSQAIGQLKTVMREVRHFITGTPPNVSYKEHFDTNVLSLVQSMTAAHSTHFQVSVDPEAAKNVSQSQAVHLLNVVREGISNTLRHAHARYGEVAVAWRGDMIRLELSDDGVGLNDSSGANRGHGLKNMKARARQMRGKLEILSKQGQGTRIILEVPHEPTDYKG